MLGVLAWLEFIIFGWCVHRYLEPLKRLNFQSSQIEVHKYSPHIKQENLLNVIGAYWLIPKSHSINGGGRCNLLVFLWHCANYTFEIECQQSERVSNWNIFYSFFLSFLSTNIQVELMIRRWRWADIYANTNSDPVAESALKVKLWAIYVQNWHVSYDQNNCITHTYTIQIINENKQKKKESQQTHTSRLTFFWVNRRRRQWYEIG